MSDPNRRQTDAWLKAASFALNQALALTTSWFERRYVLENIVIDIDGLVTDHADDDKEGIELRQLIREAFQ